MIAFDAGVLSLALFPEARIPQDFRTGSPIDRAVERVSCLIEDLEKDGDRILIPAPALCEALVPIAEDMATLVAILEGQQCFKISPFDKKTAIELALHCKKAIKAGDKKEGILAPWQKIKYDRQIVAITKAEGVSIIYTTDEDVYNHAKKWGLTPYLISDIPLADSAKQSEMFPPPGKAPIDDSKEGDEKVQSIVDTPDSLLGSPSSETGIMPTQTAKEVSQAQSAVAPQGEVTADTEPEADEKPAGEVKSAQDVGPVSGG